MDRELFESISGLMFFLVVVTVAILGIIGWGMNVYSFTQCDFNESYKAEIVRGVGIAVAPVGAVVGYIDIEDGTEKIKNN